MLHLDKHNEDYLISLPSLHIEGLIYGAPFVELNRSTFIQSSSGYTAKIDYSGKGWLSGKKNSFTATLYPDGLEREPLYTVDGQWSEAFTIKGAKTKKELDSHNAKVTQTTPLIVAPLEQQDPLESRRAWRQVAVSIEKGDLDTTSVEKSKIENQQRELRRQEQAEGREWERRYFSHVPDDSVLELLGSKIGERAEIDKTGGVWRWDAKKAEKAEKAGLGASTSGAKDAEL